MSAIKYRQWTGDRFYYWGFGVHEDGAYFTGPSSGGNLRMADQIHDEFTGTVDANGNEVFKSDIVEVTRTDGRHGGPNYTRTVLVGEATYKDIDNISCGIPAGFDEVVRVEVIGNIHQNPELLKASNKT